MLPTRHIDSKIIVCRECKGHGKYLRTTYDEFDHVFIERGQPCKVCAGTGRLKEIITIEYELVYK